MASKNTSAGDGTKLEQETIVKLFVRKLILQRKVKVDDGGRWGDYLSPAQQAAQDAWGGYLHQLVLDAINQESGAGVTFFSHRV